MTAALVRFGGLLLFLPFVTPAFAQEVAIPRPRGFVSDYAGVIDEPTKTTLIKLIEGVERRTTAEIAVLTVESTQPLDAFQYSVRVFDRWKIGKKGKDNGVLFLVAVKDRRMWITVGYGLEGILPDGKVGEIRDRFVLPHFRKGDYGRGILEGTTAIARVITGEGIAALPPAGSATGELVALMAIGLLSALLVLWVAFEVRKHGFRLGGSGGGGAWSYGGSGSGGGWGGGGFSGGSSGGFGGGSTGGGGAGGSW